GSALLALSIALAAALAARRGTGDLNGLEAFSAASTNLLSGLAAGIPLGYAFGAGMVSAANPCGFVLLPTYLGLYLGSEEGGGSVAGRLGRALVISISVTLSFVVLFGVVGLALGATTAALAAAFPWWGSGSASCWCSRVPRCSEEGTCISPPCSASALLSAPRLGAAAFAATSPTVWPTAPARLAARCRSSSQSWGAVSWRAAGWLPCVSFCSMRSGWGSSSPFLRSVRRG